MNKLRVGIIGLGGIAKSHCSAIAELDSVEVVAVADFFEDKQRQYMDQYNIAKGYNPHRIAGKIRRWMLSLLPLAINCIIV